MSKFVYLRYTLSALAILCCLILPWTVEWVPNTQNTHSNYDQFNSIDKATKSPISLNHIKNYAVTKANSDFQIYFGETYLSRKNLANRQKNWSRVKRDNKQSRDLSHLGGKHFQQNKYNEVSSGSFVKKSPKLSSNYTEYILKQNNSTTSIKFYNLELHILLFHIAILSCSSFIQLYFYFKLLVMSFAVIIYVIGFNYQRIYDDLASAINLNVTLLQIELVLQMLFYVTLLHLIDRRVNKFSNLKLDFLNCYFSSSFSIYREDRS